MKPRKHRRNQKKQRPMNSTKVISLRIAYILTLAICLVACQRSKTDNNHSRFSDSTARISATSDLDFLFGCTRLKVWLGGIMGVSQSDSTGPYYFGECFDTAETYRLIWVPKGGPLGIDSLRKTFKAGMDNSYEYFDVYAFVLPLIDSEEMEDDHKDYTPYPVRVSVYERKGKVWRNVRIDTVRNLSEFGRLQVTSVFSSDNKMR